MRKLLPIVFLLVAVEAEATTLTIDSHPSGSMLTDPLQTVLAVEGRLLQGQMGLHTVRFKGQVGPPQLIWVTPTEAEFFVDVKVPVGPQAFVPLVGDVEDVVSGEVLARTRETLYDGRYYPGAHLASNTAAATAQARLTPTGFDRIGDLFEPIRAATGAESVQAYADALLPEPLELDPVHTQKVCVDIADAAIYLGEAQLGIEEAIGGVLDEAEVKVDPQRVTDAVTGRTPNTGIKLCLRDPAATVERLEIDDVTFRYTPQTDLVDAEGKVHSVGADVRIGMEWAIKVNLARFTGLPLPPVLLRMPGELGCSGTWALDTTLSAHAELGVAPTAGDHEVLDVVPLTSEVVPDSPAALGVLDLGGLCSVPEAESIANTALVSIGPAVIPLAEEAVFFEVEGDHIASAVLEEALDSFNIGAWSWASGELSAKHESAALAARSGLPSEPWGLSTLARTVTETTSAAVGIEQDHTFMVAAAEAVLPGRTPQDERYEMGSVTSTGLVNQVLRVEATTTSFYFNKIEWSLTALGLCPKPGPECRVERQLLGRDLAVLIPEMGELAETPLRFEYQPLFAPVVTMEPDPAGVEAEAWLWLGGYEIAVVDDTSGATLLRSAVDVGYEHLKLRVDEVEGKAAFGASSPTVGTTLTSWRTSDKPDDAAMNALMTAAAAPVLQALAQMLPEVAAPEMQNITGTTQMMLSHNLDDEFRLYSRF